MYIGDVGQKGLHWMVRQLVFNSLAEFAAGHGRSLQVTLHTDGSVDIADEGRGIDPATHPVLGQPLLEAVFTTVLCGSSSGRNCLDYAVANALSDWLHVETWGDGQAHRQEFRRGEPVAPPKRVDTRTGSGVRVTLHPDPTIFPDPRFSFTVLRDWLRECAYLHSGNRISVADRTTGAEERFEFQDGIRAFVQALNHDRQPLHPEVLVARGELENVRFEVGLQWCREPEEVVWSFANGRATLHGGTHVAGLRTALTRAVKDLLRKKNPSNAQKVTGDDVRTGLTAIVSVQMAEPEYRGATRTWLNNESPRRVIAVGVGRYLRQFFAANPAVAATVAEAVMAEAGCRMAARAARTKRKAGPDS
jgi:DNA gyrase subunit B